MASEKFIAAKAITTLDRLYREMGRVAEHPLSPNEFYPVKLDLIVRNVLGWKLCPLENLDQRARCVFSERAIYLDTTAGATGERNFSLAHEIGHATLHAFTVSCYGGILKREHRSVLRASGRRPDHWLAAIESEADIFARELLMPPRGVRRHFRDLFGVDQLDPNSATTQLLLDIGAGMPPEQVAGKLAVCRPTLSSVSLVARFGVSTSAMARRLGELRLLTARAY